MQRDLERARADLDRRMRDSACRQQSFNDLVGQPKDRAGSKPVPSAAGQIAQSGNWLTRVHPPATSSSQDRHNAGNANTPEQHAR